MTFVDECWRRRSAAALEPAAIQVAEKEALTFEQIQGAIDATRPVLTAVDTNDSDANHWARSTGTG